MSTACSEKRTVSMDEELMDIYDRDGNHLGAATREEAHVPNPGFYHRPVWVWVLDGHGNVLVQKRSMSKKHHPVKLDISFAGHSQAGEEQIDAVLREGSEELGLEVPADEYVFLFDYIFDEAFEIASVYALIHDIPASSFELRDGEAELVKWVPLAELPALMASDAFTPCGDGFVERLMSTLEGTGLVDAATSC